MNSQPIKSFQELARISGVTRRAGSRQRSMTQCLPRPGVHVLQVDAELPASAGQQVVSACRAVALDWIEEIAQSRLSRKARRHRSFVHEARDVRCRGVRVRRGHEDLWAVRVERDIGPGREVVTEIVVATPEGACPMVRIHVHDRSLAPGDAVNYYPAEMLAKMAERAPLLHEGNRLCLEPIEVTLARMDAFLRMLEDPRRKTPFAVVTVDPADEDNGAWRAQRIALTRSLAGLAVAWELSPQATWRLSKAVERKRSVDSGAWRYYRPGFCRDSNPYDHPLRVKGRLSDEHAVAEVGKEFARLAAEDRVKFSPASDKMWPTFVRIARQADRRKGALARLASLLRGFQLRGRPSLPSGEGALATDATQGPVMPRQLADSASGQQAHSSGGAHTISHDRTAVLLPVREPAQAAAAVPPSASSTKPEAGEGPPRRGLTGTPKHSEVSARRYTRMKRRTQATVRERDEAVRRAEQLAGLVRAMGGDSVEGDVVGCGQIDEPRSRIPRHARPGGRSSRIVPRESRSGGPSPDRRRWPT